jgi:hypothetical protein
MLPEDVRLRRKSAYPAISQTAYAGTIQNWTLHGAGAGTCPDAPGDSLRQRASDPGRAEGWCSDVFGACDCGQWLVAGVPGQYLLANAVRYPFCQQNPDAACGRMVLLAEDESVKSGVQSDWYLSW